MALKRLIAGAAIALAAATACNDSSEPAALQLEAPAALAQSDTVGHTLARPYEVAVTDLAGTPVAGITVTWTVLSGSGSVGSVTPTNAAGISSAVHTLGTIAGPQAVSASLSGAIGSPVTFTSTALAAAPASLVKAAGDAQTAGASQPLPVPLGVLVRDAHGNPTPGRPVAWARVAGSGTLAASQTATDATGIARVGYTLGTAGTDTVSAALVGSVLPPVRFTATAAAQPTLVAQVPIPASYGIHDTFVRDGLAFVSAWNTGIMIFDVGNGIRGGSPASPQLVSTTPTAGGQAHNAWWFHNPNTSEKKYLFVGQEGPGAIGSSSSGDIHVLDVTSLVNPVEVATYHLNGAGTHNFWIDEQAQILYAAYYNAGVVALDVSGALPANLASRELWRLPPGGAGNTYTWGVQLYNGSVYAIDMLSGLWQLRATAPAGVLAGGNNVPERYGSDLWVHGGYAYTGTWGFRSASGNAVKIWQLDAGGAPTLVDSIVQPGVSTVSDIEVSADGTLLIFSAYGSQAGLHVYALTNPARPTFVARALVAAGLHTATLGMIGGRLYVFAAKDPPNPALMIYDVTGLVP